MTSAAAVVIPARAAGRLRTWVSLRHPLPGKQRRCSFCTASISSAALLWLHRRRPAAFPFVRTTLLLASCLALIGFLVYPTAPPRLAGIGVADTVSEGRVSLNHGLVSFLYNPYAAVPSMHIAYALVVAASLLRHGGHPLVRALGLLYAPAVLLVVVATGNHFFLDAAAGAVIAGLAAAATAALTANRFRPTSPRNERRRR